MITPEERRRLEIEENHVDDASPLIGLDGGFTYISIVQRLPKILQSMIDSNRDHSPFMKQSIIHEQLKELEMELANGDVCTKFRIKTGDDSDDWKRFEEEFQVEKRTWLELAWFFVENYFYRIILEITGYYVKDSELYLWDPFGNQKQKSLDFVFSKSEESVSVAEQFCTLLAELPTCEKKQRDLMREMIVLSLWGNQADLSLSVGLHSSDDKFKKVLEENILSNDLHAVMEVLEGVKLGKNRNIAIIMDNCGLELVSDMYMADTLLRLGYCDSVTFYGKVQPVFVSDVTERDFFGTISQLQAKDGLVKEFADRFQQFVKDGKWKLKTHPFFTGPLQYSQLPADFHSELNQYEFIFIKGDANYRRTINDAKHPVEQDFNETLQYFPCKQGVCCLRTIKSYSLIGIKDIERLKQVAETHKNWRYSGDFGVVELSHRQK